MKHVETYFIRGQGGVATSGGVDQMATEAQHLGGSVQIFDWGDWKKVVTDVNKQAKKDLIRLGCGYSMGGNAFTWVLGGVNFQGQHASGIQACAFDFVAFIDPTTLSVLTPLTQRTLRKALHYKNHSIDIVGHADLPLADFGTSNITIIDTHEPHLTLDFDPKIQAQIMQSFKQTIEKCQAR